MRKWSIVLLAILLATVALVPVSGRASADESVDDARIAPPRGAASTSDREAAATTPPIVGSYSRISISGSLNQRTGPGLDQTVIQKITKGEIVKVVSGPHNQDWYKVTYRGKTGYSHVSGLAHVGLAGQSIANGYSGKILIVSRGRQQMEAYQGGKLFLVTAVTTGRPELLTPLGTTEVLYKKSPLRLTSSYPKGHKYYYDPKTVRYGLAFRYNGYLIHDAPWAPYKGYGTNVPHQDPDGVWRTGSLGCVRTPEWALDLLYPWAPVGTPVKIISS